jgi:hypothetical protein
MSRHSLALLALLLAGCGSAAATATASRPCRTPPPASPPQTAQPPYSAAADAARVDPGGSVNFTETVTGPAVVQAVPCSGPLQLVVSDGAGLQVYSGGGAAVAAGRCGTVTVPAGSSVSYQVPWPVDPSLPGGYYTAALVLGAGPTLSLTVAVGALPGSC